MGTPWDPHPSSWQATQSGGIPTYPGKGQVHLQFGDAASDTGTNPIAEGDGAEGVVRGAISPEPALRQEPLRLGEVGLIVGHRVVRQDKEGLWGKKWGLMTPPGPTEHSGGPHGTALTHILGEEVVSDDNVLLIEDPGIGGHHRVDSGIWGELVGEEDSPGDPRGREPRQDRAQQLPGGGGGGYLQSRRTEIQPCILPGWCIPPGEGAGMYLRVSLITARSIGNLGISSAAGNRSAGTTAFSSWYKVSWMSGSRERWYKAQDSVLEVWGSGAPGGVKELGLVPEQPCAKHSTGTAPESPCSGAQKSQG